MTSSFFKYKSSNKVANLNKVSNVKIDFKNNKVFLHLAHTLKRDFGKTVADYVEHPFKTDLELNELLSALEAKMPEGFIFPYDIKHQYVNLDYVSSIVIEDYKNKIIFNLSAPITHPEKRDEMTSDFVYWTFSDKSEYLDAKYFIESLFEDKPEPEEFEDNAELYQPAQGAL